jgi:transposase InsO family protein
VNKPLSDDKDALLSEIESLKRQVKGLKLEKAILEGTAEIIKKDPGVDPKNLTNKEKAILADALRDDYPLKEVLACLGMARSNYFYHRKLASIPGKYAELRHRIIALFEENSRRYGYRRIHALLVRENTRISEKVVRRIMGESELIVFQKRRRKYCSYQGEETPGADNLIERNFHADAPNIKWLTDITEFAIPAGKVYLSPIVDCFDGLLPSWSIGTSPDADLVNSMLDCATETLREGEHPLVHSDRGGHYRWPGWISRMEKACLQRSMSKKGCSPDNAACEGFFGRLKNEMFYNRSWIGVSLEEFIDILNRYLVWYNEKRIKLSLGAMSPLEYRQRFGLSA